MQIHLSRNGAQSGPFTEAELREKLTRGEIAPEDLAWHEGMSDWQPVKVLLGISGGPPPPLFEGIPTPRPLAAPGGTSGLAIGSLICGIVGFVVFLPSLAAVIMGHIALGQIKRSQGTLGGRGLAIGGLVTGYIILSVFLLAILASLLVPAWNMISSQQQQQKGAANCKQIVSAMMSYAAENNGLYPDSVTNPVTGRVPLTSNEAFRTLFQEGIVDVERIFGSPASRFFPDGDIGAPPAFDRALTTGENHWAMTAGQSNTSSSLMPLVFENPVAVDWPPQWNADAAGKPVPGRTWQGGKIIIGKNDGSVETIKLEASRGKAVGPGPSASGRDIFTEASDGQPQQILNILAPSSGFFPDPLVLPGSGSGFGPGN